MRKTHKQLLLIAPVIVLACVLCIPAFAATPTLDYSREGSVTLTLHEQDANKTPVSDAALTLYKVGDIDKGSTTLDYILTPAFEDSNASLFDMRAEGLVAQLAAYATDKQVTGVEGITSFDGQVTFEHLSLGLYLVVQQVAPSGHYPIKPFLVSIPMTSPDGTGWVYDINASPKVETQTAKPSPQPASKPSKFSLIQTGQLNWPIPVLAIAGVILFAVGWALIYLKDTSRS